MLHEQKPAARVQSDEAGEDRLLLERARLALQLILAGVAVVFVGELVIYPGRNLINVVQAVNFAAVAGALSLLRDPARRSFNTAVGFAAYVVTIVSTGIVGVLAKDAITPVAIMIGMSVVSATFVPWSIVWQLASIVVIAATAAWMVSMLTPSQPLFWLQDVGAIAPTLVSTLVISRVLRRQRAAVAHAEGEWRSREEHLQEANRRLEQEIAEHQRTEDTLRFAMRELDHRVKNTLATVQSVADQTFRSSRSLSEFGHAFSGRIQAMAQIHTALAQRRWEGLPLTELIDLVVGPYRRRTESISIACDGMFVSSDVVRVLGMTLHELATNAAKYGALSADGGQLDISCVVDGERPRNLRVQWIERGGPRVEASAPRGFGVQLIEEAIVHEVAGRVSLRFLEEGVRCEIEIPLHGE